MPTQDIEDSGLDKMSDSELESILKSDYIDMGESDHGEILSVIQELAKRKRMNGEIPSLPEQAYEKFFCTCQQVQNRHKGKILWYRAGTTIVAMLAVVVMCFSISATALDSGFLSSFLTWTKESVCFSLPPVHDKHEDQLEDALRKLDIPISIIPLWLPDGYKLTAVDTNETPVEVSVLAEYSGSNDMPILLSIRSMHESDYEMLEQSHCTHEEYKNRHGVPFYIFSDNERVKAVWFYYDFQCYLSVDGNIAIKKILNSITLKEGE